MTGSADQLAIPLISILKNTKVIIVSISSIGSSILSSLQASNIQQATKGAGDSDGDSDGSKAGSVDSSSAQPPKVSPLSMSGSRINTVA